MVTVTRQQDATAPNDSKYVLKIQTSGSASPRNGGFYFGAKCGYRKVLVARIIAKIPAGRNLCWATNSVGTGGSHRWLTSNAGTGDWKEYVYKVVCGTADFSSTHFFYVDARRGLPIRLSSGMWPMPRLRPYLHGEIHDHHRCQRHLHGNRTRQPDYRGFRPDCRREQL